VPSRPAVQERTFAGGLHAGQVARFQARGRMPNSENAAVDGDKAAMGDPRPDLRLSEAGAEEFVPCHDAVGSAGELSEFPLDRGVLWSHHDH
jgi:hypothetical protein